MKTLYLDTSTINHLYDDPNLNEIKNKLKNNVKVYLSIFNVVELASTNDRNRRINLINLAKELSENYRPLAMPGDLLKRSLIAICTNENTMDNSIGSEWESIWVALNEPELIDDDYFCEICEWKKQQEDWYQNMHENGRPSMQKVILELPQSKQQEIIHNFSRIVKYYSQQKELISEFIERVNIKNKTNLSIDDIRQKIITHSEHWRFFLAGMVYGLYVRSIRAKSYSKKKNPGSIDTQQSIYLATCDILVSADYNQYKMMRVLVPFGHKKRHVWYYPIFRKWVLNS